ncbi:MAG: N-formylglutamate deformylase [Steroidobacteraceae bacterium]
MSPARTPQPDWLQVQRGNAALILSLPHSGTGIPADIGAHLQSQWLARKDTDWWVHELYDFAAELGATVLRTTLSRTVIDVNRDPSGASLYPGQPVTEMCPTTTFDGEALYFESEEPDAAEVERRRRLYFDPYHSALRAEIARLRSRHARVVVYDAHAIRSRVPRLFDDELPHLNLGTNSGHSCAAELASAVAQVCATKHFLMVRDGRFKGGHITRHYGQPAQGVHALQMELACRGYMREPAASYHASNWPTAYQQAFAAPLKNLLREVLRACLTFTHPLESSR